LDEVVAAYLQNGERKLDGLSGLDIESESADKQLEYCLQDAQLCMKLLQKRNYELLQILYNISKEVNLSFFDTCNSGSTLQWWTSKLRSVNYPEDNRDSKWIRSNITKDKTGKKKGIKYTGGRVLEPVAGMHIGAKTYDVSSMYPSMSIVHNISSETVNCECCKTDPEAKILPEVMQEINKELDTPRPWGSYSICRKQRGKLSKIMEDLLQKKEEYKAQGLTLKEKSIKLLMNSGYGTFGQVYFKYYDPRVAELITGFARYTLDSLVKFVNGNGGKILFGDTDSIFTAGDNNDTNNRRIDIVSEAKELLLLTLPVILFDSNNADDLQLSVGASDRHTMLSGIDYEQTIKQDNVDLVAQTPGATLVQAFIMPPYFFFICALFSFTISL